MIRRFHSWLGIGLGALIAVSAASGFVLSWFSDAAPNAAAAYAIELDARGYANPGGVIAQTDGATELTLRRFNGQPVYEVRAAGGASLFDALSGEKLPPIGEATIRAVAEKDIIDAGDIESIALLDNPPREYDAPGPVWRVAFADDQRTRLYISSDTGMVEARRSRSWRIHEALRRLHALDFSGETDGAPMRLLSVAALLYVAVGAGLMAVRRWRKTKAG
ncbi:MAG: hypothetical protein AB7P23_05940 [Amphiplicatus sp.]